MRRLVSPFVRVRNVHVNVLFGSQTGNASYFASQLAEQLSALSHSVRLAPLSDCPVGEVLQDSSPLIVVCSVFGEGEPPDNAKAFCEGLDSPWPAAEGDFAVMGLGDSRYAMDRFNIVGKTLDSRFEELGKSRMVPFVAGDAANDIEGDFERFATQVIEKLPKATVEPRVSKDEVILVDTPAPTAERGFYRAFDRSVHNEDNPRSLICTEKSLLTPPGERVCSEIVFSQAGNYETGDYLGVFPENPKRTVDAIIQRCALDPDQYFSLRGFQSAISMRRKTFPNPCSVREFLARFCDLRRPLPKESVKKLQRYADSIDSKRVAAALENRNTFVEEFHHKPFDEILAGFPSIKLGLADLVDILPAVKPLYYSIASSRLVEPDIVRLVVGHHVFGPRGMEGLLSTYLTRDLQPGMKVEAVVKKSLFRLPKDPAIPIIMVGVGSGIAPFLGFMKERVTIGAKDNHLFYGVLSERDLLYADELRAWESEGNLSFHTAFGSEGVFAQHILKKKSSELWNLIYKKGAHLYVCGHTKLGDGVDLWLRDVIGSQITNREDATAFYDALYEKERYRSDVFA